MSGVSSPTGAYLVALTPESSEAIQAREINVPHLPFRIGRESRKVRKTETGFISERRTVALPNNDLYLVEETEPMNVSREHLLIDKEAGGFYLLDRGSTCGTLVEGVMVGGKDRLAARIPLSDHDVIIVGTSASPYIFKFRLES